jgi:1-acyl-sn-glycerol-3-phosphate acyltransferase
MTSVLLVANSDECIGTGEIADHLIACIEAAPEISQCRRCGTADLQTHNVESDSLTVVYLPEMQPVASRMPDLIRVSETIDQIVGLHGLSHLVVISDAAVYGARPHNPGLIPEDQPIKHGASNRIAAAWGDLEQLVTARCSAIDSVSVTLLRSAICLFPGDRTYFGRLFQARIACTLAGHDPSIQLLHPDDFAHAIVCAIARSPGGVYNVAPDGVIPLRPALKMAGVMRFPTPRWPQRLGRSLLGPSRASPIDQIEYIRYSWTVSNRKIKEDLGFRPVHTSPNALRSFLDGYANERSASAPIAQYDDLGLDKGYLDAYGRTLFRFLNDIYWRIECVGAEHIPSEGRALLAGVHRGFMPLDGVMSMDMIVKHTGRYPRFLIHPTLIKFPFQFNFMTKIGGVIACQQNADYVLGRDELVGFYPEGIQGAFRYYKGVYKLGRFGRNEFVRMALRNQAPIVPFVTIGNAEIFPVLGKIKWNWWKRFSMWPVFPIAPPFPFLPVPLPSKWHVKFLEPIHVEKEYPPEAAQDPEIVRAISDDVRAKMQAAIDEMLARRKSIFFGSVFKD